MDVKAFLDRVEMVFGVNGATRLARALGVPQGRVEGWYARLSPDMIFIIDKLADRDDVDIEWLITGKVKQQEHDRRVAQLEGEIHALERQLNLAIQQSGKNAMLIAAREACDTVVSEVRETLPAREEPHRIPISAPADILSSGMKKANG